MQREYKIISNSTDKSAINYNRQQLPKEILNQVQNDITDDYKNLPIAFFDSGVGGLTVYEKLKNLLPCENYMYFGDTKNMPYGEKTEEQLIEYAEKIFNFFEEKKVKAVVMACNTTSAITYDKLKDNYCFKIYPIIQSVSSVIAKSNYKKIGVFATHATINSHAYSREIKKYNSNTEVFEIACPEWVRIVEENKQNQPQSLLQVEKKLEEMSVYNPEKIILGCTHYPYLLELLKKFMPADTFIDPSVSFAKFIKDDLEKDGLLNDKKAEGFEEFYVSSSPENFQKSGRLFYDVKKLPSLV